MKELTTLAPTHWVRVPEGPLLDEALNEMGRRLMKRADSFVFYSTFSLERLYPLSRPSEGTKGRPFSARWFGNIAGEGFGRRLGNEVKVLVAAHWTPGHFCLAFVDFQCERFVYADPLDVDNEAARTRPAGASAPGVPLRRQLVEFEPHQGP